MAAESNISTGLGNIKVFARDGSVWLKLEDEDGDCEGMQSLSVEVSMKVAAAILDAAIWLRS